MDVGAALLLAEMRCRRARHVEAAHEMDLDHHLPVDMRHAVEDAVAQYAGVVDDAVDAAEGLERGADDALGAGGVGDAVGVGDGRAAGGADLVDDLLRGAGSGIAFAVRAGAEIVDHDAAALASGQERDLAADAASRAGDDDDLALEALRRSHSGPSSALLFIGRPSSSRISAASLSPGRAPLQPRGRAGSGSVCQTDPLPKGREAVQPPSARAASRAPWRGCRSGRASGWSASRPIDRGMPWRPYPVAKRNGIRADSRCSAIG